MHYHQSKIRGRPKENWQQIIGGYENVDIYEAAEMNINENAAYSIITN